MRHTNGRRCAILATVAVLAATGAQAQGGEVRMVTAPGGRSVVVLTPTAAARASTTAARKRGAFRPLPFKEKIALVQAAGGAAPPASDGTFTLTPSAPFQNGRGFLSMVNADIVVGDASPVAFETGAAPADMRVYVTLSQLEARRYLVHYSIGAGATGHFHVLGGNAETDIAAKPGDSDIYVVVVVSPAQAGQDRQLAILSGKEPNFYWDFMGVEITPM